MRKILSNPYGRDLIRIVLLFLSLLIIKYVTKSTMNSFVGGCIEGVGVGSVVLLIRFLIKKPKPQL